MLTFSIEFSAKLFVIRHPTLKKGPLFQSFATSNLPRAISQVVVA